jgi:hypothetical protein
MIIPFDRALQGTAFDIILLCHYHVLGRKGSRQFQKTQMKKMYYETIMRPKEVVMEKRRN